MTLKLTIPCPYCGKAGKHAIEEYKYSMAFHPVILNCDCESNGCDKNFAVLVDIAPQIKVFKLEEVK